jgi:3-oxoadipate CoA-transferase beta subunit
MSHSVLTRQQIAQLVADSIPTNSYVNLGIGMPSLIPEFLSDDKDVIFHSENGIVGIRSLNSGDQIDEDILDATKNPVALIAGAAIIDHVLSFSMMRGGHIDISVLGAYQVSGRGDIANWHTGDKASIPGVGGAMDLVVGAKNVYVMMSHVTQDGQPKIVDECSYPLTGCGVVDRIYTDLAVMNVTQQGLIVTAIVDSISFDTLQNLTATRLKKSPNCIQLNIN